ncbi:MAG: efflux RND transporter periplasmic adaptor subunit [Pseudomonadota bacterium]|nr:efflux RND transporter periplasmic adaptor subunit [Pseudomonadota bacterium]
MTRRWSKALPLSLALAVLAAVVVHVVTPSQARGQHSPPRPGGQPEADSGQVQARQSDRQQAPQRTEVTVVTAETAAHAARINAYGEASAHFELTLSAEVSGRVDGLADNFEGGLRIGKGELLATLEDSGYQEALAVAQSTLATAEVSLLEEQRQGEQSRIEWRSSGLTGEPDSPLVLRAPQLAAAQAAVDEAKASLAAARQDLDQTRITAPFDALITDRHIAPGSFVQSGTEIATLVSTDRIEITVSLSAAEWSQLPDSATLTAGDWPVTLTDIESGEQWTGQVIRAHHHLDATSRQRSLVIAVQAPFDQTPALLPGTFLEASLSGRTLDGLWHLPATALGQSGQLWYVTDDDALASVSTEAVFSDGATIYVRPPEAIADQPTRVVVQPLSSYVQGMLVTTVEARQDV